MDSPRNLLLGCNALAERDLAVRSQCSWQNVADHWFARTLLQCVAVTDGCFARTLALTQMREVLAARCSSSHCRCGSCCNLIGFASSACPRLELDALCPQHAVIITSGLRMLSHPSSARQNSFSNDCPARGRAHNLMWNGST